MDDPPVREGMFIVSVKRHPALPQYSLLKYPPEIPDEVFFKLYLSPAPDEDRNFAFLPWKSTSWAVNNLDYFSDSYNPGGAESNGIFRFLNTVQ